MRYKLPEKITIDEYEFCEHCEELEPYTATYNDGVSYCLCCIRNGDITEYGLTHKDIGQIEIIEYERKIKYFEKRVKSLKKELKNAKEKIS